MIAIIADDHPLFRVALSQALQTILGLDASLYQAHSMAQLWPLLREHPDTQLILLDLKLPDAEGFAGNALVVPDPYAAYARVSHLFDPKPKAAAGIHPTAVIAADAVVDPAASIGPFAVIESAARIAAGVTVGAHCFIGARSEIG